MLAPRLPYGYLTVAQYETRHEKLRENYYHMLRDILINHLQSLCVDTFVEGQYRKKDHLWFSVSRDLRHNLYQSVQISPLIPLHWVKVRQPDGSRELEDRMQQQAERQNQTRSDETAELVILNSHQPHLIEVTPSCDKPVTISLDLRSETSDPGEIGCDCFMEVEDYQAREVVHSKGVNQFDIMIDCCVPRELPLPKKQEQPSASEEPIAGMYSHNETILIITVTILFSCSETAQQSAPPPKAAFK